MENYIDKTNWGRGPWDLEPDYVEFEHCGFRCILKRFEHTGVWNGYVEVSDLHPWFHVGADEARVHGGVTWKGAVEGIEQNPNCTFIGFDCAHGFDVIPAMESFMRAFTEPFIRAFTEYNLTPHEYRTVEYATEQIKHLANQACQAGVFVKGPSFRIFTLNSNITFSTYEASLEREFYQ